MTATLPVTGTVRAVVVDRRPGQGVTLDCLDLPRPGLGPDDLLVAPQFVGVCGSDLELVAGHSDDDFPIEYPHILGHEWSGTVLETGAGVPDFAIGQLVVGHGAMGNNRWFGVTHDGAMAEAFRVPAAMCYPVPDGVSPQRAAMVEPLACVLQGLHSVGGADASHVCMVFGCGTLGLAMVALLHSVGATVIAVDPSERRRDLAADLGADVVLDAGDGPDLLEKMRTAVGVDGADLVVEASGAPSAQAAALQVTALHARVLLMGLASADAGAAALRLIQVRLLTVTSSVGAPPEAWVPALRLLQRSGMDLTPAVSNVFSFEHCREALVTAADSATSGKVMLAP